LPRLSFSPDLLEFASSYYACGINGVTHLENTASHNGARAPRQFSKFLKRFAGCLVRGMAEYVRGALQSQSDQKRALPNICCPWSLHALKRDMPGLDAAEADRRESTPFPP
jgi:hypothetical protein